MIFLLISLYAGEFQNFLIHTESQGRGGASVAFPLSSTENPAVPYLAPTSIILDGGGGLGNLSRVVFISGNFRIGDAGIGITAFNHYISGIVDTRGSLIDENNNNQLDPGEELDTTKFKEFDFSENALILAYARGRGHLSYGVNFKFIYKRLGSEIGLGTGLDIGLIYRRDRFSLGVMVKDVTTSPLVWTGENKEIIPQSYFVGGGVIVPLKLWEILADADLILDEGGFRSKIGLEGRYNKIFAIRFGFDNDRLTSGAGLSFRSIGIDYSIMINSDYFPTTQRVSISKRFY